MRSIGLPWNGGQQCRFAKVVFALVAAIAASVGWATEGSKTDSVLQEIRSSGVVKIGYMADNSPFSFPKDTASVAGFSIDICSRVVEQIRRTLQLKQLEQKYIEVQADERIPKLKSHAIHMECGASTNTVQRQREVAFSYTMFVSSVRMMVRRTDGISDYRDLAGKRVAALKASTAQQAVALRLRNLGIQAKIIEVPSDSAAVELLEAGKADVYANDEIFLFTLTAGMRQPGNWVIAGDRLTVEPYAIMLPKDAPGLVGVVDTTMAELFRSGEFVEIYDRWFQQSTLKLPMGHLLRESIRFPNKVGMPETW